MADIDIEQCARRMSLQLLFGRLVVFGEPARSAADILVEDGYAVWEYDVEWFQPLLALNHWPPVKKPG